MLYQAQGNLQLLIRDLVQAAPEAWLNHGTRVLLEGRPIRTMGYESLEDLDREVRWLLTLRALGMRAGAMEGQNRGTRGGPPRDSG